MSVIHGLRDPQAEGINKIAQACVRRLLEIGLPEDMAFRAKDAVYASLVNAVDRKMAGEWEPR